MNKRIEKFRNNIKEENLDGFIVYNPVNIEYLTGLKAEGVLVINKYYNLFLTDSRYIEEVKNQITIEDEIILQNLNQINNEDLVNMFLNHEKVGFEENYITYSKYRNMIRRFRIKEAIEGNNIIDKMRLYKDDKEIELIETACNITDSCFLHLLDFIKEGMTEKEIAFEIEKFFIEQGADGLAFDSIVASGSNTSKPHAIPTEKKIKKGDPILIDFGAKYKGYCADMTRTIFLGEVSEKQQHVYDIVKEVQSKSLDKMKSGADCKDISNYVVNEFAITNNELIHALGHGVGLDIHEIPFFSTKKSSILRANMIVTNEPGIYIAGDFGIRIEDTVLIKNDQPLTLTKSNKNLIII